MTRVAASSAIPRTLAVINEGLDTGRELGTQLAVSLDGQRIAEVNVGADGSGGAMRPETMLNWFSMTKASTAVSILQLWERGLVGLDDPVVKHLPDFGRGGADKDKVTVRHLLTHTGGFRFGDGGGPNAAPGDSPLGRTLHENLERIYDAPLEAGWVPGEKAGYHPTSGMSVLAGVIEVVSGETFDAYVRQHVFEPLEMRDCWIGMPPPAIEAALSAGTIGTMHRRTPEGEFVPLAALSTPFALGLVGPGASGRGPMKQLVHLYEALVAGGQRQGERILGQQTVEAMLARHRVGMHDHTFGITIDWSLGLHVDSAHFGRHCSPRAAGHGGAQSSVAFCDPRHGLAVACICNSMIQTEHAPRMERIFTALYVDLGLATADAPGRDHPYPKVAA